MAWNEAIEFIKFIENKFGGWRKIIMAWAHGWIRREDFMKYTAAQKIIRGF